MDPQIITPLLITTIAGLSTTIGSILGLIFKRENSKFMSAVLGFTAGVMIGISFFELLPSGFQELGFIKASIAFIAGFIFIFLIDFLIPHEYIGQKEKLNDSTDKKLLRTGIFVALGIAIHNFPEGIAVSAPIYKATGSRKKAFLWSFLSGVVEPIGALLTALVLLPFINPQVLGYLLSGIAGLMVFIAIDELLPVSKSYGYLHLPIVSFIAGMIVMILSLILIK